MAEPMQIETPSSLSMSVHPIVSSSPNSVGDKLQRRSSSSSSTSSSSSAAKASRCPFLSSSSSSPSSSVANPHTSNPHNNTSHVHAHTCPFAAAIPSSREPVLHTLADGTVVETRRRCPRWVRVLRFSAKFIAKQVLIRTAKTVVMKLVKTIKHSGDHVEDVEEKSVMTTTSENSSIST